MARVMRTLRAVQWMLLASIVLSVIAGRTIAPGARPATPALSYLFSTIAVAIVGVVFVVRRSLVLRAAESLAQRPDDSVSLRHWQTGHIATYALCEMLALFGLALRVVGGKPQQSLLFYIGGFVLLLFFRPRAPVSTPST